MSQILFLLLKIAPHFFAYMNLHTKITYRFILKIPFLVFNGTNSFKIGDDTKEHAADDSAYGNNDEG